MNGSRDSECMACAAPLFRWPNYQIYLRAPCQSSSSCYTLCQDCHEKVTSWLRNKFKNDLVTEKIYEVIRIKKEK